MKKIYSILATLTAFLIILSGCQQVEDLTPSVSRFGINSLNASFYGDESSENNFSSEIEQPHHRCISLQLSPHLQQCADDGCIEECASRGKPG